MTSTSHGDSRRSVRQGAAVAAVVLLLVGLVLVFLGVRGNAGPPSPEGASVAPASSVTPTASSSGPSAPATPPATTSAGPPTTTPSPSSAPQQAFGTTVGASAPVRLEIPSIGLASSTFVDLGVAADGTITVPGSADEVGFYAPGPTPGELGPAVLAAHVDSKSGPGVFYRLGAVKAGSTVIVHRQDGSTITFTVDKVATYPKDQFPTDEVYHGSFTQSEIRLVTCGGPFDKVKHYLDNVVVFGHLTATSGVPAD